MQAVIANAEGFPVVREHAGWQRTIAKVAAILLGIMFLVSGGWKMLSPFQTGELLEQAKVHAGWGPAGAAALGTLEVLAAFLLFAPRLRRWGGALSTGLLIFFIGWIGYYYRALAGRECSCFPIIKRSIGPGFFVGDGIMLLLAIAAYAWSERATRTKLAAYALVLLTVLSASSYAAGALQRKNVQVPTPVIVNGKPQDLSQGKVFLFFYDPSCMHCDAAAKFMSKLDWGSTRVIAIPTINPQWAASFLHDTHLKADTSLDLAKLRKAFQFVDPPFGVALDDGRVKETFGQAQFNEPLPQPDLKKLDFIK